MIQHFQNTFSLKPLGRFQLKPPWDGRMKVNTIALCHMTKVAVMHIYGKTFKNLLLWNKKAADFETWYAA